MGTTQQRNKAVDWIKGVMITIIVFHHYFLIPGFNHTYLPVDFFFCISGYYLMDGFIRRRTSAIHYTYSRVKRFYPAFLITLLLSCILLQNRLSFGTFSSFIQSAGALSFLLTLTNGLVSSVHFPVLDISWFLSILIIAGYLIYALLDFNDKFTRTILLPIAIIFGYTLIFTHDESIQSGGTVCGFCLNLVRGCCDMSLGVLVCDIYRNYKEQINRGKTVVNLSFFAALLLFFLLMASKECFDIYAVITLPFIAMGAVYEESWLGSLLKPIHGGLFSIIGKYTLEILMTHQLVMFGVYKLLDLLGITLPLPVILLLDLILVFISSWLLRQLCNKLFSHRRTNAVE